MTTETVDAHEIAEQVIKYGLLDEKAFEALRQLEAMAAGWKDAVESAHMERLRNDKLQEEIREMLKTQRLLIEIGRRLRIRMEQWRSLYERVFNELDQKAHS